jgi:hypothetical protein
MAFSLTYNEEKNQLLKATRRVNFEDVLEALKQGNLLADIAHPSQKHPRQRLYVVKIKNYVYAVPYVSDARKQEIFLKTIYPSRMLTKIYLEGGKNE